MQVELDENQLDFILYVLKRNLETIGHIYNARILNGKDQVKWQEYQELTISIVKQLEGSQLK